MQLEALGLGAIAGTANILGGYLAVANARFSQRNLRPMMGFGGGFMLGAAVLEMIPESFAGTSAAPILVVLGYLTIYLFEHLFASSSHPEAQTTVPAPEDAWPESPGEEAGTGPVEMAAFDEGGDEGYHRELWAHQLGAHSLVGSLPHAGETITPAASAAALIGLLLHAFFDGAAIAAGFLANEALGIVMFGAIILHKLPAGLSLAVIMQGAGHQRRTAFASTVAIGVATVLGTLVPLLISTATTAPSAVFLAFAAGTFIYIAASDLIPATSPPGSRGGLIYVFIGAVAFWASASLVELALG